MKKVELIAASLLILSSSAMAGTSAQVEYGTVQESHLITQTTEPSHQGARPLRTIGAAALGAAVGNQFGGGSGQTIATVTGAVAGAEVSRRRQSSHGQSESTQSVELQIKTDGGKVLSVVQASDPRLSFTKGDRVRILTSGSDTSVDKSL
ncbi:MAG: glycine zipper 2TM domain-containing protein [Aeromonas sp.]|uniref:glycine zipper 2TM domain-containing protein n=1 Tax=Aeromonas sp. TaxID=647 RepID=UPI003F3BB4FA